MKISEWWIIYGMMGYGMLFILSVFGFAIWWARRRNERPPLKFKLLRGPGETLRRKVAKMDEDLLTTLIGAALVPVISLGFPMLILKMFTPTTWPQMYVWFGFAAVVLLVSLFFSWRWAVRHMLRWRDYNLGYLGEREVGEHLVPLLQRGYRVFHDIPAEGAKKPFNLDHVTVGPSGVTVIETKTRRKGRARPGMKDHVVTYDGRHLIWPWGEDSWGLQQAIAEADWLRTFINQRTGIDTPVKAILALPGWWVEARANKPVAVVNSKSVATAVHGTGARLLTDGQVDLIARQLDQLCRDVED